VIADVGAIYDTPTSFLTPGYSTAHSFVGPLSNPERAIANRLAGIQNLQDEQASVLTEMGDKTANL
jgi:hypothetical protein